MQKPNSSQANEITVRTAVFSDALPIFTLIKRYPDELVPRSMSSIVSNIDRFYVCCKDDEIIGSASWAILPDVGNPDNTAIEIQSLAVSAESQQKGMGRALVNAVLEGIKRMHPTQVFVLTFTPGFFETLGFEEVAKKELIHKIYMGCINCTRYDNPFTCPEVAMRLKPEFLHT